MVNLLHLLLTKQGKAVLFVILAIFTLSVGMPTVSALTESELHSIYNDTPWYRAQNPEAVCGNNSAYTALFPTITDDAALINSIRDYMNNNGYSTSPLIDYIDSFVSIGRELNVNPVMLLGIAQEDTSMATRGNGPPPLHNFGNIRDHDNGGWRSWSNYPEAIRAHYEHLLGDLYLGPPSNFTTVDEVITRWAPPTDGNDTAGYIADVKAMMDEILGPLGLSQSNVNCACGGGGLPGAGGNTVVIDPGHGPGNTTTDQATGLTMVESNNQPEGEEVWDVSQRVKTQLESAGYTVMLTKQSQTDQVTFRQRANVANNNNAAVAVSIHDDHTQSYAGFKDVWPQRVGQYRGEGTNRTEFTNAAVATASQNYAQIMKEEREAVEGGTVNISNFQARLGMEPGNIPMVMLFSQVPWVYHEVGGGSGTLSNSQRQQYADGIANGIKKSVPLSGGGPVETPDNASCACVDALLATATEYAWPEDRGTVMTPAYEAANSAAAARGEYTGGPPPGIDCGAYVTRAMLNSQADLGYNYSGLISSGAGYTAVQKRYLDEQVAAGKYELVGTGITNTSELMPGDIAIAQEDHTYFFVGDRGHPGHNSLSASQSTRAPSASDFYPVHSSGTPFSWYRLRCANNGNELPTGNVGESTTCAEGSRNVGTHAGYRNGQRISVVLCAINDLMVNDFTNEEGKESTPGSEYYIDGANNRALVSASVSRNVVNMVRAAREDGVTLVAFSSFRTHEHQRRLCGSDSTPCPNGGYAAPGHSRHQLGQAIDFVDTNRNSTRNCRTDSRGFCSAPGNPTWEWLTDNAGRFGYRQLRGESWHWSPDGE